MAEKSACPPLASKKRGSDARSEVWQTWGPVVKRIVREVKAHPEVWASRCVVPRELDVGNWGGSTPYRPSEASNSMATVEMGVSGLHSAVSRYVGSHREPRSVASALGGIRRSCCGLHWLLFVAPFTRLAWR
jgi:hypothetical protein